MMKEYTTVIENRLYKLTGEGAINWKREEGTFLVKYENGRKVFDTLGDAYSYFIKLDISAELLDLSDGKTERLIEGRKILLI